jgi:CBS domain-containing membrane protein
MSSTSDRVKVADVMTSRVRTASPDRSVGEVWKILVDEKCHHIPIVDADRLVGIISTTDLVALVRENGSQPLSRAFLEEKTAADVMTTEIETIQSDESVDVAIDRIGPGAFHALVVVDDAGALAGIVTHHDLLYYLGS